MKRWHVELLKGNKIIDELMSDYPRLRADKGTYFIVEVVLYPFRFLCKLLSTLVLYQ